MDSASIIFLSALVMGLIVGGALGFFEGWRRGCEDATGLAIEDLRELMDQIIEAHRKLEEKREAE